MLGYSGKFIPYMCNTAPNNVVAANVGKDVTVIYQADGKRAHIPSVRNDGIVVIAGKVTINIAVVIRAVDVESVSIACTIRFAVVNFFAVAAVSNRPNLVAITSAGVNRHIAAIIGSSATFHVQIVIPADRFVTNVVMVITGARVMTSLLRNHPKSQNLMRRRICAMKTLTKKILTVCLTLAMACTLAIPAFADFDNGYNGYKSWSVPGFADPFLWLYDTTPCTSSPLIVPNCKKASLNAKSDANLRIRSGSYFMNCEINLNRTSCSSDVGVGDGETLEWLCWRSKAANSVNSLICSSLKS